MAPTLTEREKMLAGQLYNPRDPELTAARGRARDLCLALNQTRESQVEARRRILCDLLGSGGETVFVQPPFFCDYGANIHIGPQAYFNFNCTVLDVCEVRIGEYCQFGPGAQILTPLHPLDARLRRGPECGKPVTIGADVWVGGGALILAGVTIGAGSVVARDIPAGVFAAGNPCRVIRAVGA